MSLFKPKVLMWMFGLLAIGGVALFLTLYQGSPGPLAAPHAAVMPGSFIWTCNQCHAEEGLEAGCLSCHTEIAGQLAAGQGYHAYLQRQTAEACEACHAEHLGAEFQLVNAASWPEGGTNAFTHPHVEFTLTGKHDGLSCEKCHVGKRTEPYSLPDYPDHPRTRTMLGLVQECITCHEDVHRSGERTRDCTQCHDQNGFKPAPLFSHDRYFVLEGPHARASCASCHQQDVEAPPGTFGPVKGKTCIACHENPHRFEQAAAEGCLTCHRGTDEAWSAGRRGVDVGRHDAFGFELKGAHASVECVKCHAPSPSYGERFPDPALPTYRRQQDHCSGCHADPHAGQFGERYASCAACHDVSRFKPSTLGPAEHPSDYPLKGGHAAVACIQCHESDPQTGVRRFAATPTACRACHADPHRGQFDSITARSDCTVCHRSDFSTFRVSTYTHQTMRPFFTGKGHAAADCRSCHAGHVDREGTVLYTTTPTECAACHADIHRGQFRQSGTVQCTRCHGAFDRWTAAQFDHEADSRFRLDKAHAKLACSACHRPVPQRDGQPVVQYKPLTTKCEDCHGFQTR